MKTSHKLIATFSSVLLIFSLIIFTVVSTKFSSVNQHSMEKLLDSSLHLGSHLLNAEYPGEWSIQGDKLYKGSVLMNENYKVVDLILEDTGAAATLFLGDTRISTNVRNAEGNRAIGTKASQEVVNKVLRSGLDYQGQAEIVGEKYQTLYSPIKDVNGTTIGMWFVGVSSSYIAAQNMQLNIFLSLIIILLMIVGIVVSMILAAAISNPLKASVEILKTVSEGDYTVNLSPKLLKKKDEIGDLSRAVKNMIEKQSAVLKQILLSADEVSSSAQETSSISEEMTSASQNQSSSMNELTVTMEQMSKSIEHVAMTISSISGHIGGVTTSIREMGGSTEEIANNVQSTTETITTLTTSMEKMTSSLGLVEKNAHHASAQGKQTVEIAHQGTKTVEHTIEEMTSINTAMSNLTTIIKGVGNSAVQIGEIIDVIDDIAEQTNLLSLNASIEAARAGEHGKGFAVVAGAIGKLAERSSDAAKDIAKLIKQVQETMTHAITSTEQGAAKVHTGVQYVKDTGRAFDEIFSAIQDTTKLLYNIAESTSDQLKESQSIMHSASTVSEMAMHSSAAIEQQVATVEEIIRSIDDINQLSQEVSGTAEQQSASSEEVLATSHNVNEMSGHISSASEEVAKAAEHLAHQASTLQQLVSNFKIQ